MMIGSLMMIKIINNIGHYSFFLMALANTDQPPAFNNVHQTTPSGVPVGSGLISVGSGLISVGGLFR